MLPIWLQVILTFSLIITAMGVIWTKFLKPGAQLVVLMTEAIPLLRSMSDNFKDSPEVFSILKTIGEEFHTNSGTTLRDVINRIEKDSVANKAAIIEAKELAERTNARLERLLVELKTEIKS